LSLSLRVSQNRARQPATLLHPYQSAMNFHFPNLSKRVEPACYSNNQPVKLKTLNLITATTRFLQKLKISLLLQVQFLFKVPTPAPAPAKILDSGRSPLRHRDHLWFTLQLSWPEVATDPECQIRLRPDSAFFFRTRCEAKFLTYYCLSVILLF